LKESSLASIRVAKRRKLSPKRETYLGGVMKGAGGIADATYVTNLSAENKTATPATDEMHKQAGALFEFFLLHTTTL